MSHVSEAVATVPEERRTRLPEVTADVVGLLVLVAVTGYFVAFQSSVNLYTFNLCLLAAIGAVSLNLLLGTAGLVSIGNAAFLAVGAYGAVWALRLGVPFPANIVVAAALAAVVGFVVGLPALRLQGLYVALATLSAHFITLFFVERYQRSTAGSSGFFVDGTFQSFGVLGEQRYWAWTLLAVLSAVLVGTRQLLRGRTGRAWRLVRTHETVASCMGVPVARYKLGAFVLSSVVIAVEGALTAHFLTSVSTERFTLLLAVSYIAMVIIGGLDSLWGGVIGAAIVVSLPSITSTIVGNYADGPTAAIRAPQISTMVYGALVIFFVTRSPEGIVGWGRALTRLARRRRLGPLDVLNKKGSGGNAPV